MPVGTTDYRERLRGPGAQDVLGMILRGVAMPGGRQAAPDDPALDPEGQQALRDMFGTAPPSAKAGMVDAYARDVHRQIIGAPPSKPSQPEETSWLERLTGLPSVARQLQEHERTYAAATARGGGIAPAPSDMDVAASGLGVAGNFDFTGTVGMKWYHGGSALVESFDPSAAHPVEYVRTAGNKETPVFWAALNSSTAYDYASSAGAKGANAKISEFNITPKNPKVVDVQAELERLAGELGVDVPAQGTTEASALLGDRYKYDIIESALDEGHDAVVFKNFADTPNYYGQELPDIIAFTDPKLAQLSAGDHAANADRKAREAYQWIVGY